MGKSGDQNKKTQCFVADVVHRSLFKNISFSFLSLCVHHVILRPSLHSSLFSPHPKTKTKIQKQVHVFGREEDLPRRSFRDLGRWDGKPKLFPPLSSSSPFLSHPHPAAKSGLRAQKAMRTYGPGLGEACIMPLYNGLSQEEH